MVQEQHREIEALMSLTGTESACQRKFLAVGAAARECTYPDLRRLTVSRNTRHACATGGSECRRISVSKKLLAEDLLVRARRTAAPPAAGRSTETWACREDGGSQGDDLRRRPSSGIDQVRLPRPCRGVGRAGRGRSGQGDCVVEGRLQDGLQRQSSPPSSAESRQPSNSIAAARESATSPPPLGHRRREALVVELDGTLAGRANRSANARVSMVARCRARQPKRAA